MEPLSPDLPNPYRRNQHILVLRAWLEELDVDLFEWRAFVQTTEQGERGYIRSWEDLEKFLEMIESRNNPH